MPLPQKSPPPSPPHQTRLRGPSFVQEKHGRGAPTTPTMPHQRGAENYNSREAAHRGPPTLRGLQSHVQASLVNSARARAATEQASRRQRAPVHSGSGLTASVPRVPPTPAPLRKHAPDPLQTRALQARTPPGSPAPPHARSRGVAT